MASANMDATEAAKALQSIGNYEEQLTRRAHGITLMIWGMASAAIFLTYGTADPYLEEQNLSWLFAVLWVPWVVAGSLATRKIWEAHAITVQQSADNKGWIHNLVGSAVFIVIAAGLFVGLDILAGIEWAVSTLMTVANGLFALLIGLVGVRFWGGKIDVGVAVAGAFMLLVGVAAGIVGVDEVAATLLGASACGLGWIGAGLMEYRQG